MSESENKRKRKGLVMSKTVTGIKVFKETGPFPERWDALCNGVYEDGSTIEMILIFENNPAYTQDEAVEKAKKKLKSEGWEIDDSPASIDFFF